MVSDMVNDVILMANSGPVSAFNPDESGLTIRLPGVFIPGQEGALYSDFEWDGLNQSGQGIKPGLYYVKVTIKDTYGSASTVIKEVTVLRVEEYVRLNIYNSAGELVNRIEVPKADSTVLNLSVADVIFLGKEGYSIPIGYAPGKVLYWDGKNMAGRIVGSGVYEIELDIKTADGYRIIAAKSVTVFKQASDGVMGRLKVYPNPNVIERGKPGKAVIAWENSASGKVSIKVYNVYGEMITRITASLASGSAEWDMKTSSGNVISSGLYALVIEAVRDGGETEVRIEKMTIIRRF